jgi:hypothetical protein
MKNDRTIHDLIIEQNNENKSFLVPSYQRGYRWQRVNVSDLLNDLNEFIHSDKETYSLQPLVVYAAKDNTYHVVDGQQRLTTISILLGYLKQEQISIIYESRKGQQNYFVADCNNIDQYHVNQAYCTIKNWFETHPGETDNFIKLLTDHSNKQVKFIWYCTTDDEVATFIRLNKNKISLTNAELIKALLLKKGNFSGDSILMQKSIAIEWNKIENTFNDDSFWGFLRPIEDDRPTRIDFLFEVIKDKNLLSFEPKEDIGNDQYTTFRYFYQYFKAFKESAFNNIWEKVNRIYNILSHWYNEIEVYHYIGFLLMYNNSLMAFIDEWTKPDMTIDGFKEYLEKEINSVIGRSKCNNLARQYKYNEETNPDKTACTPILLLFNIQRIIILNKNLNNDCETQLFDKFPFYLYKEENWNVEHIASNTDNDFSKTDTQKEWLKTFLFDNTLSEKDKKDIKKFIKSDNPDKKFEDIKKSLDDHQKKSLKKEERLTDKEKNQIWNFCLLDEHTNKSYGNSIFPVKRRIIMGKEMGKKYELDDKLNERIVPNTVAFVPGCTKDAFIKAYTANDTSNREWSRIDAIAYRQEMYECLKSNFNVSLPNES